MRYDEFIQRVADRTGLSADRAEALTRATLITLGERISGGEAQDLASQLPKDLQSALTPSDELAEGFDLDEFVRRVKARAGTDDQDEARDGARAVFLTLGEAVTGGELRHVLSQLPEEFREFAEPVH